MEIRLERGSRVVKFTTPKLNVDRQWDERDWALAQAVYALGKAAVARGI